MTSAFDSSGSIRRCAVRTRRTLCLTVALAISTATLSVQAEDADPETRTAAREMATQGAEAFEKEDYETALDRFQRASALFRAPSISVMEARTLVKLGRLLAALDKYEETRHIVLPPDAPEALQRAVSDAAREGEALRARVPFLRIDIVGKPGPGELKLTLDGKPVPSALLNVERPLDPGRHEIEATSPGRIPIHRRIDLSEAEHRSLEIQLGSATADTLLLAPGTLPGAEASAPGDSGPFSGNPRATWGFVATGLGAVALGTSAVTGVIALGKKSDLDAACHPGCPASSAAALDSFRLNRTLSYTSFFVGVAGLGVGGYLLLGGSPSSSHVSAGLTPQGAALSGAF